MSYDIFISYRREGGDTLAQLIYDRLTDRGYRVFLDIESLRSGKFNEKLLSVIEECKDVVVILPPNALERCSNPEDWLYLELSHAIKSRKNIVPVMMKGFAWPDELPEALRELPNFNGIQDSKDYFDAVIDKMTSLLHSKPAMFGAAFGKLRKGKKKSGFKEQIARRKKLILSVFCILLVIGVGIGAVYYQKAVKRKEMATNVSIVLTASDDMTPAQYYDAIDILKERIKVFAGDEKYSLEVQNEKIEFTIPVDAFHRIDVAEYLRCYLTRAMKLYLKDLNSSQTLEVSRSDIANLEYENGAVEGLTLSDYFPEYVQQENPSLIEQEEYRYFELTFTDEFLKKADEIFDTESDMLILAQDAESVPSSYCFYRLFPAKDGKYYFVDNYQDDTTADLTLHNYTSEPLAESFSYNILFPVEWEYVEETKDCGTKQCNVEDLSGPLVTLQYHTYESDVTEGNDRDALAVFKKRLDALGTPYAIGRTVSVEHGITIKMAPERLNVQIVNWLGERYLNVYLENRFYPPVSTGKNAFSFHEKEDGTYQIAVSVDDFYSDDWEKTAEQVKNSSCPDFWMVITDTALGLCSSEAVEQSFDTGILNLDSMDMWGIDTITEEYRYLLDFLEELTNGAQMPIGFSHGQWRFENVDDRDHAFPVEAVTLEVAEELQKEIEQICPTAEVSIDDMEYLVIWLELETNAEMPEKAVSLIRQIYELADFENARYYSNMYVRCDAQNNIGFFFLTDQYSTHEVVWKYLINNDSFREEYEEQFRQLTENDPFFTETVAPEAAWDPDA